MWLGGTKPKPSKHTVLPLLPIGKVKKNLAEIMLSSMLLHLCWLIVFIAKDRTSKKGKFGTLNK